MGALADGFVAFAQPLIDQTDGSTEQLNHALSMGQLCYNLALMGEDERAAMLVKLRPELRMNDDEFEDFVASVVNPMIRRHEEMFPRMHRRGSTAATPAGFSPWDRPGATGATGATGAAEAYPGTDRYAPCPCNSGEKYKFCCGKKRR